MKTVLVRTEQARDADIKALRDWVKEAVPREPLAMEAEIRRLRKIISTAQLRLTRVKDQSFQNTYVEVCHAREILGNGVLGKHGVWP